MPKLTVELPQGLINQLDQNKREYCEGLGVPVGIGRVNLIEGLLTAGIEHAQSNGNTQDSVPELPPMQPIKPIADNDSVDWENITTKVLTQKHIERLDNSEILAYIIGEAVFSNSLDLKNLAGATPANLTRRFDLEIEDANRLSLLFEFAKRLAASHSEKEKIVSPVDVADYLMPKMRYLQHEVVICMALNTKGEITDNLMIAEDRNTAESAMGDLVGHRIVFEGTLNSCPFHPREIFRHAIDCNANTIILAHNHPSGDPQPSQEDIRATKQLIEAGNQIGIKVLDHIVIGDGIFVSLKEENFI